MTLTPWSDLRELASRVVTVRETDDRGPICPRCRRTMKLRMAWAIPDDGWTWLWWWCECDSVTQPIPLRLKRTTGD